MVTITFFHFFSHFIFGFAKMDKNKCPKSKNQKTFGEKKTLFFNEYIKIFTITRFFVIFIATRASYALM